MITTPAFGNKNGAKFFENKGVSLIKSVANANMQTIT
jgi:hypothetical protein